MNYMQFIRKIFNDSLLKNSLYLIATNLLNLGLGFFFWVIAARYYTPQEVGTISAILSSMFLISMISALGFHNAFIFYLPKDKKNASKIINSGITSSIVASLGFSIIFVYGLDIWAPPLKLILNDLLYTVLFAGITAIMTTTGLISAAFIAGRRSSFHMIKELIFGIVKILPLQMLSVLGAMGIFLAWGIGAMLAVTVSFFGLTRIWKGYLPILMLDPIIKDLAWFSAWNYIGDILYSLPRLILPIMIINFVSTESTSYFFIAMMIAGLLYGIPQSISNSLLAESSDAGELWHKVKKSIKINAALLFPGVLFFILLGKFVLNIFNPLYAENASTTLNILSVSSLPFSIITTFITVRTAQKKVLSVVKINAAIASITLVLALPLLKISGIEGAAVAFLLANSLIAIVVIYKMRKMMQNLSQNPIKS